MELSEDAGEVPVMIERILHATKQQSLIAYDQEPGTGDWWVVEVLAVTLEPSRWGPELASKVEAAMRWTAEQDSVSSLAATLEAGWPVVLDQENIDEFDKSLRRD
jgi:hypothetical protein